MAQEHGMYVNGELWLRFDEKRVPPTFQEGDARAQFISDATRAMVSAHAANTDTPMDPAIAATAADWVWFRFISLRPTQLEALIAIQVAEDRCDASALSMITGAPVSSINAIKRKAVAAKAKADELAAQAAAEAPPAAAPAAAPPVTQAVAQEVPPAAQEVPPAAQATVQDVPVNAAATAIPDGSITPEQARAEAAQIEAQNLAHSAAVAPGEVIDLAPAPHAPVETGL